MIDILNDNQKLALVLELYNAGDISNAIKIAESYRPKGKWINQTTEFNGKSWVTITCKCSVCGDVEVDAKYFNYCPNCGADMRGGE